MGHPQTESLSFLMWSDSQKKINDQYISIIGPELNESKTNMMPFAKIVLIGGHGFNEDNAYARYQEMDLFKFRQNLDGYMLRAIPQENREWSRISYSALKAGFSLQVLGNELIREFKSLEYVDAVEIIFITSSKEDIQRFKPIGEKVSKITQAMNKMFDKLEYDCANCGFRDVCNEVEVLRKMREKINKV